MWDAFADALRAAKANGQTAPASVQTAILEHVREPDPEPEPERQPGQWGNEADTGPYDHDVETERGDDLDFQTDERVEFLVELAGKCEMTTQSLPWAEIFGQDGLTGLNIRELTDDEYDAVYHWLDATYTRLHPRKAAKEKAGTT